MRTFKDPERCCLTQVETVPLSVKHFKTYAALARNDFPLLTNSPLIPSPSPPEYRGRRELLILLLVPPYLGWPLGAVPFWAGAVRENRLAVPTRSKRMSMIANAVMVVQRDSDIP